LAPSRFATGRWKPRYWLILRQTVQGVVFLTFLALIVGAKRGLLSPELGNLPVRLDPLTSLLSFLAGRVLVPGLLLSLGMVLLTLLAGRAWCGWLCPLGTALDLFPFRTQAHRSEGPAERWRLVKYLLLVALVVAALLGNLTLAFLDPITIFIRTISTAIWPALDRLVTGLEAFLYPVPFFQGPLTSLDGLIRPDILPITPTAANDVLLFAAVFAAIVGLNAIAHRFWCRYLCPLGGLLGLLAKVSLVRRKVSGECNQCAACARVCPTGTIDSQRNFSSDTSECTMCLECLAACPRAGIQFTPELAISPWQAYDPKRREVLLSLGAAVVWVSLLNAESVTRPPAAHRIRPPGVDEATLLERCIRCGICSRTCPTGGIHPAIAQAGLDGFWTPVLIPRLGYCDYSCNACGQACPTQAIPMLPLAEKQTTVIGSAYIDQNRCIAWADGWDCIVCQEMCPVPDKAVILEKAEVIRADGTTAVIQRPEVLRDRCIGCGICEYKCPVDGEAAIRVYLPDSILNG
jgi:polyferredoxin